MKTKKFLNIIHSQLLLPIITYFFLYCLKTSEKGAVKAKGLNVFKNVYLSKGFIYLVIK